MKQMLIIGIFLLSTLVGCGKAGSASWSENDRRNAQHMVASFDASQAVTEIINQGSPFSSIPLATTKELHRLYLVALDEARKVNDQVLEKVLPGLSKPFREKYQKSIELQLRAIEQGDIAAEFTGSQLHDEWVDWINPRTQDMKIPK